MDKALWLTSFVAQSGLWLTLLIRKRLKGFPVFTAYIGFQALTTISLFFISKLGSRHLYFWSYWATGFAVDPLSCWLVIELAQDAFRPVTIWVQNTRKYLVGWAIVMIVTAVPLSFGVAPSGAHGFDLWENRVSIFTALFICGMIAVIYFLTVNYGLGRPHAFALAQGLFVSYYSVLLLDLAHAIVGWNRHVVAINYARESLYLAVLIYWTVRFWTSEKKPPPLSPAVIAFMNALHDQVKSDISDLQGRHQ